MTSRKPFDRAPAGEAFPGPDTEGNADELAATMAGLPSGQGDPQSWVGRSLGKYQITSVLGRGAMAVVLKARDPMIERDVAIKVLADHLAADSMAMRRFLSEARS